MLTNPSLINVNFCNCILIKKYINNVQLTHIYRRKKSEYETNDFNDEDVLIIELRMSKCPKMAHFAHINLFSEKSQKVHKINSYTD